MTKFPWPILISVIILWTLARFAFLSEVPYGFYIDEASGATNAMCLQDEGRVYSGKSWPLFSDTASYGFNNPVSLYSNFLGTKIAGRSVAGFRSIVAFFSLMTIIAMYLIARLIVDNRFATFVAVLGLISPWSFQFGRIAWDCPLLPCFTMWGIYFFIRSERLRDTFFSAVCFSFAMYSYQAGKVSVPVIIIGLGVLQFRKLTWQRFLVFSTSAILICIPLIQFTFGDWLGSARYYAVSIFAPHYFRGYAGGSWTSLAWILIKNFAAHFSPNFLFFQGDVNLRHSPIGFGQLSWVDAYALVVTIFLVPWAFYNKYRKSIAIPSEMKVIFAISILGLFAAILPAAITHNSIPHALRAIGAWPFFAFISAWGIYRLAIIDYRLNYIAFTLVLAYSAYAFPTYFFKYQKASASWFDGDRYEIALANQANGDWSSYKLKNDKDYNYLEAYYLMAYGGFSCQEAREFSDPVKGARKISH